ncbi:hypothetical protein BVRB_021370 [Beta vulgaris subsp. vulgaris]|uniref:Uncharacterized protein n=1 Tax=Beta vulgaris subsp. vulgaris TaxID=3555 RepID=A0A0J8B0B0_BETVV|nr:hypothetical protein BVRB_021370 [Beta vulgaris subsp. vulgaris]
MLRIEFKVPAVHSMQRIKKIVEMSLFIADQIASIKLTSQARSRATSIRSKVAQAHRKLTHEERSEQIQRKKLEALEQQRNALSGDALRQFEERQQKLSMKRRGPKMKIMR